MTFLSVDEALSQAGDSLEVAASLLWSLDSNRLRPAVDYRLDVQSRTEAYSHDAASYPLVEHLSDDVWQRPTYGLFKKLLDNYTAETGIPEVVSQEERAEEDSFLSAICGTAVIEFAFRWLSENSNMQCESMDDFSSMLKALWFHNYSRDGSRDSSGFEHVFCGELDDGQVKGLHNFVQVFIEEQRGNFNYQGYLDIRGEPSGEAPPVNQQLITVRFEWLGETKPCSSMFVGVSPEFEFALYTLIYVAGREELELQLGAYDARIKVYQMAGKIGTAFPELLGVDLDRLADEESGGYAADAAPPQAEYSGYDANDPTPANAASGVGVPPQSQFPPLGALAQPAKMAMSYAGALGMGSSSPPAGGEDGEREEVEGGEAEAEALEDGAEIGIAEEFANVFAEKDEENENGRNFCGLNVGKTMKLGKLGFKSYQKYIKKK